jgi:hypothetical protein
MAEACHVDAVEALAPRVVTSAHGPVMVGDAIHNAFDRGRARSRFGET